MPGLAHFFKNASFWSASVVPYSYTIKYLVTLSDYIKHGIRPRTSTSPPSPKFRTRVCFGSSCLKLR